MLVYEPGIVLVNQLLHGQLVITTVDTNEESAGFGNGRTPMEDGAASTLGETLLTTGVLGVFGLPSGVTGSGLLSSMRTGAVRASGIDGDGDFPNNRSMMASRLRLPLRGMYGLDADSRFGEKYRVSIGLPGDVVDSGSSVPLAFVFPWGVAGKGESNGGTGLHAGIGEMTSVLGTWGSTGKYLVHGLIFTFERRR